jgi:hypothetical protein
MFVDGELDHLVDVDLSRPRLTYGVTDAMSLTVTYNYTVAEAKAIAPPGPDATEPTRTHMHETVHVYQMLASSYGYYCQLLRDFQAAAVILMVRTVREGCGLAPQLPIVRQVLGLPDSGAGSVARTAVRTWYLAELMLLWFEGEAEALDRLRRSGGSIFDAPMVALYAEMDWHLTHFLRQSGRAKLPELGRSIYLGRDASSYALRERPAVIAKYFVDMDAAAVLESAARAVEYWGLSEPVPPRMYGGTAGIPADMGRYQLLLQDAVRRLSPKDTETFVSTYTILADVVLNAPLLPHHAAARGTNYDLPDLDPATRMLTALTVAQNLALVRKMTATEYVRFAGELCAACHWPTPWELAAQALSAAQRQADVYTSTYYRSLMLRRQAPQAFCDLGIWFSPKTPLTAELLYYFSPPIMQFTDGVRLHNDQPLVRSYLDQYLVRAYLRRAFLSNNPTVVLPYSADDGEIEFWTRSLARTLADAGFRNPKLTLIPGPIGLAHPGS